MKLTILGCDFCTRAATPAVVTLTLVNGKPKASSPALDLCRKHYTEVERYFTPRSRTGRPRGSVVPKEEKDHRAKRWDGFWRGMEEKVLLALKGKPEGLMGPDLAKATKLSKHFIYKIVPRLMAAKKIERIDPEGRKGYRLVGKA